MITHNKRSSKQWDIITQHIKPETMGDKRVVDLGCGYGDILYNFYKARANCIGIEGDEKVFNDVADRLNGLPITLRMFNLNDINQRMRNDVFDIGVCFSVLPYVINTDALLAWMSLHCKISLIECQYAGDGPGFAHIRDDSDMAQWLNRYFHKIKMIGQTEVNGRNASRSIWMCK